MDTDESSEDIWSQTTGKIQGYKAGVVTEEDSSTEEPFDTLKRSEGQQQKFKQIKEEPKIVCHDPNDREDLLLNYLKSGKECTNEIYSLVLQNDIVAKLMTSQRFVEFLTPPGPPPFPPSLFDTLK